MGEKRWATLSSAVIRTLDEDVVHVASVDALQTQLMPLRYMKVEMNLTSGEIVNVELLSGDNKEATGEKGLSENIEGNSGD